MICGVHVYGVGGGVNVNEECTFECVHVCLSVYVCNCWYVPGGTCVCI